MRKIVQVEVLVPTLMDLEIESQDDPELPVFDVKGVHKIYAPSCQTIYESFNPDQTIEILNAYAKSNQIIGRRADDSASLCPLCRNPKK